MNDFERLRPVGPLEKYSTTRHSLGLYFNVAVSATYILPDTFTLPLKDYVYKACETLIGQHPILSAIPISEDTEDTWFVRLPEIDLSQSVAFQRRTRDFPDNNEPDVELCELLRVQHSTGFAAPLPYWRLFILTDEANDLRFTAVYVFHHAIGDGTSGKAFHQTFLDALHTAATFMTPGEVKQVIQSPTSSLLPNLEALHPCPTTIPFLLNALFRAKVWSHRDPRLWTGAKISAPVKTELRQIIIPVAVSAALRKNCRQNNATVTAALQAAVARALLTHLPVKYTKVQMNGAISCRRWLKGGEITDQSMGVWVMDFAESFYRNEVNRNPDTFPWDQARKSRATIEQALGREGKNAGTCLLKHIDNFQDLFRGKIGKDRDESFEVSNVGVLQSKQEEDPSRPQTTRAMFSQTPSALGAALEVSSITGGDGCLVLGITWQTGVVEPELVNAVIDTLVKELHDAAL
ncbi:Alcohol acetyltransferase [Aspergillus tubingensis]